MVQMVVLHLRSSLLVKELKNGEAGSPEKSSSLVTPKLSSIRIIWDSVLIKMRFLDLNSHLGLRCRVWHLYFFFFGLR